MKKYLKIISLIMIVFVFCVCNYGSTENAKEMVELVKYENEIVKETRERWHPDIEELKSVEEDKSLLKEKEEFLQLFKEFAGFSLPDYFIIPKAPEPPDWRSVNIDERNINVDTFFIVEKNDALKMLKYLREDDSWWAFGGYTETHISTPKAREKCTIFKKSGMFDESLEGQCSFLYFIYDQKNDFYILDMYVSVEKDPPPGTSWPVEYCM